MSSCHQLQIQRPMSQAPRDPWTTASTMVAELTERCHTVRGLEPKRSHSSRRSDVKKKECGNFKLKLNVKDVS